jgi:hypothetical protein
MTPPTIAPTGVPPPLPPPFELLPEDELVEVVPLLRRRGTV